MPTYKISYYNDEYLTELLFEEIYDEDVAAKTPTIIPTKEPDKYYIYDFNRWSMNVDGIA